MGIISSIKDKINSTTAISSSLSPEELEQLKILADPVTWAKVYLSWTARDYQVAPLRATARHKLNVFRMGRRLGKCLPGWVKIFDPKTGDQVRVEELYRRKQASIATMTDDFKIRPAATTQVWDNGIKEVFRVTLASGRYIDATGNHPLYTIKGWKEIDDLKPGDRVATPRALPYFGNEQMPDEEVILLAYMLGDGNCTGGNLRFTAAIEKVADEMDAVCRYFDSHLRHYDSDKPYDYHIVNNEFSRDGKRVYNGVRQVLEKHGMWGHGAADKVVPPAIFRLPKDKMALFLSRLFATDGWVSVSKHTGRKHDQVQIGYASCSHDLALGVQHLLLRFGIQSSVTAKRVKYEDHYRSSWQLTLNSTNDIRKFATEIGIWGKEDQIAAVLAVCDQIKSKSDTVPVEIMEEVEADRLRLKLRNRDMMWPGANHRVDRYRTYYAPQRDRLAHWGRILGNKRIEQLGESDLYWDEIVSIESIGFHQTYDLTVPVTHNFVANDIVVHNTETVCVSILWHAFTQPNKKPVRSKAEDQYNILIVTPGEAQIKLIFDRLHQLIAASPILQACIARDIENRIEFTNGTIITGLTAGSKSNTGAQNTRGQRADLIILDESDYMNDKDINNLINIRNEAPERIKIIAASTPTGKRAAFYRWCTGAPHNGWMEHYAPSTVNPEIHKINPDTGLTYLEELRNELSALAFEQEVMANFGEEAGGVYRKVDIDAAVDLGRQLGLTYWHRETPPRKGPRVLGVDWDKCTCPYGANCWKPLRAA